MAGGGERARASSRDAARFGRALGADGLVRLVGYGALLSPHVLDGRGLGGIECEGPCVVLGKRLAFRVRRSAYATLVPLDLSVAAASGPPAPCGRPPDGTGTGACNEAEGCVYRLTPRQVYELADREGGYRMERLRIRLVGSGLEAAAHAGSRAEEAGGAVVEAVAFIGTPWDLLPADAAPSARYLAKVQTGAAARGLSKPYRAWLQAQQTREGEREAAALAGRQAGSGKRAAVGVPAMSERGAAVVLAGVLGGLALVSALALSSGAADY